MQTSLQAASSASNAASNDKETQQLGALSSNYTKLTHQPEGVCCHFSI